MLRVRSQRARACLSFITSWSRFLRRRSLGWMRRDLVYSRWRELRRRSSLGFIRLLLCCRGRSQASGEHRARDVPGSGAVDSAIRYLRDGCPRRSDLSGGGAQSGDVSHGSGVSRWHGLFCLAPRSAVAAMESSQSRSVDGGRLSGGRGCWYGFALAARASTALQASSKVRADDSPKDERLLLCKQMARMEELHRQSIPTAVSY